MLAARGWPYAGRLRSLRSLARIEPDSAVAVSVLRACRSPGPRQFGSEVFPLPYVLGLTRRLRRALPPWLLLLLPPHEPNIDDHTVGLILCA